MIVRGNVNMVTLNVKVLLVKMQVFIFNDAFTNVKSHQLLNALEVFLIVHINNVNMESYCKS